MKVGILGGGLTGLTVASNLKCDTEIIEKNKECGGLCRSIKEKGFTFDWGGAHIIYSKDKKAIDYFQKILGDNYYRKKRNNKIYFKKSFVKYPFENGLSQLPLKDTFECLYYYLNNKHKEKPSNFKEWVYFTFGKGIAEKYLIPYNKKIWKYPLHKMSLHWVKRVPKPPKKDVIKSSLGIPTEGYKHQLYFYYPKQGGIQTLIKNLEEKPFQITKNYKIRKIKKEKKWIVYGNNKEKKYDKLISTIPVFDLVSYLENVPQKIKNSLKKLKYNSLITILLGVKQKNISDFTAIYFPQPKFLFNRIAFPKNFSEKNAPPGKSSVIAEITSRPNSKLWKMEDKKIIEQVSNSLSKLKIIDKDKICYQKAMRSKYAYVIYNQNYLKNIKIVKNFIKERGIELCGRFSEFEYLNMDACIKRALKLAKKINNK